MIEMGFEPIKSYRVQVWSLKMTKYSMGKQSKVHWEKGVILPYTRGRHLVSS